ncbi:MAG TPA: glycosyltransferase 87 family protein [Candidatus Cybelea sp.]|nr:glycosyltransferase 87 family protein [Candidatus Cybelea sp.]
MRGWWIAAGIVLATLLALVAQTNVVTRTGFLVGDFRAFYCAARVASTGASPYLTEPLGACERSIGPVRFFQKNPNVTIPAPLPGYAIAALEPFSRLPFAMAASLWVALLGLAWLAAVWSLARFAGTRWEVSLAFLGLSLGALSLPFGEVVPLSAACICLAGYFAWRGRWLPSGLFAAGAMIEPHLGLPVCLALAVWAPATRLPLLLALAALGALSLRALGSAVNVEYFTSVLPAHALSELTRDTQYSTSAVLAALGVAPVTAVRLGGAWYAAMLVAGTFVAGRLARKTGNAAFLACVPPAFAVFGGSFIHVTQIAVAAPAAALLIAYAPKECRDAAVVAALLLIVPWGWVVSPALIVAPLFPVGYLAWRYWEGNQRLVLFAAIGAALLVFGLQHLYTISGPHIGAHPAVLPIDPRLPEASWSAYSRGSSGGSLAAWAVRLPTWGALGLLLWLMVRSAQALSIRRESMAAVVAALFVIGPIAVQFGGDRSSGWLGVDFRAYYCAALAQRERADPYFASSLHNCEANTPAPFYRVPANVTVPAPYPPYVMAMMAPLTLLPFTTAATLWWLLLAAALALAAWTLARLSGREVALGIAALGLSAGLTTFSTGNMLPLGLCAVLVAALSAQRGKLAAAAVALTLAMVEPQIALPAAIGFFVAFPAMRLGLIGGFALLGALCVFTAGAATTLSYATAVVPAHALAEVSRDNQYSLATVAAAAGVPDAGAALLGSVSFLATIALGVAVGIVLARRYGEPALAVLVPPAISLLGGSFVHTAEIAAAVPAALLLFGKSAQLRGWLLGALVLLAVPWMYATSAVSFLAPFVPVAYLVYVLWQHDRRLALGSAIAAFAAIFGLFSLSLAGGGATLTHSHAYPPIDPRLAEASWRKFVLNSSTNHLVMWLLRLPTWAGSLTLVICALLLARPRLLAARAGAEAPA